MCLTLNVCNAAVTVRLRLKLIADAGVIGNAGKSIFWR